jgi:hypothetical protein
MKHRLWFFVACLLTVVGVVWLNSPADGPNTRHILFIGNSFTSYNDMPAQVEEMARNGGKDVRVTVMALGGYTLQNQWNDNNVLSAIDSRVWDAVILQEQSQRFAFRRDQVAPGSFRYGEALANRIRQRSPKAHVYWYQTWGYKNGDADNCTNLPEICSHEGMARKIAENISEMARLTQADVVEVGTAWKQYHKLHPEIELYDADGKHPSPTGSQLAAQAFYNALFP